MFDFPNTPVEGQIFAPPGGPRYQWNSPVWDVVKPALPDDAFAVWPSGTLRTMKQRATDTYCILDAPGGPDPTGVNDSTTALKAMVAEGIRCEITRGSFICHETLVMAQGQMIDGFGGGYKLDAHSRILFTGTGAKTNTIPNTPSQSIANPDVGAPYLVDSGTRGDTYRTNDFTVPFSAGIIMDKGSRISNLGVYPTFNGDMAPYKNSSSFAIADDWDVGIWARNAEAWTLDNVNSIGHWRKAAFLASGDLPNQGCQAGRAVDCTFNGMFGVSVRAPDIASGTWGFAGTMFDSCNIQALWHQSSHLATSSMLANGGFPHPSGCLEMGGLDGSLRGIKFYNSTFIGIDDICMIFSNGSEMMFGACYMESQPIRVSGGGSSLANSHGSRIITIGSEAGSFRFDALTAKFCVDFSPWQRRDGSLAGKRYVAAAGLFNPTYAEDGDYDRIRETTRTGPVLRKAPGHSWGIESIDAANAYKEVFHVSSTGETTLAGAIFSGVTVAVNDDTAIDLPTPRKSGYCSIVYCGHGSDANSDFTQPHRSGLVFYEVGGSTRTVEKSLGGAQFVAVNTDVTGTTGTDGNLTIGCDTGKLRIENRAGGNSLIRYFFFG